MASRKSVTPSAQVHNGLLPTPPMPEGLPKANLTENARKVLMKRYVRRGDDGKPAETVEEMFWRVAYHVAKVEEQWDADVQQRTVEYYHLLSSKKFFPNSPTFTGAGTPLGQLAACFVLPITDDMGRDSAGIFQTLRDAALIQQTGGGNGFSFSRLRPKGALVQTSAGQATGPVGFLRVYDHAFGEIAQGGTRRGANMAVLRVDHPDVEDFVTSKTNENHITNFNISVGITDAFMRAVKEDGDWELRFPDIAEMKQRKFSGTLEQAEKEGITIRGYQKVKARELFNKIIKQAHHNGEPGVLFLDASNRSNPVPHLYPLEATNPCHRGTNLVHTDMGPIQIKDLVGYEFQVLTPDGNFALATAYPTGIKPLFRVHLSNGYTIDLTANHNLITDRGSKLMVRDMKAGDKIKLSQHVFMMPQMELAGVVDSLAQPISIPEDLYNAESADYATVVSVEDLHIVEDVYNLTVDHPDHQFAVNGIISANCGEQWLGPYENCCLGSVNLNEHCGPDGTVDWELLRQSVVMSTRFLDDVVESNAYVPAVPQLKEAAHRARRIGLGIMGLADLMYHVGVRYGSPEGQEFGAQVMEFVRYHAMQTSVELAEERGPFPAIEGSIYDMDNMTWTSPKSLVPSQNDWGRPAVEWDSIVEGIRRHGIRNAAQTTVAPTGTIATVAGCEGYGCEPVFALAYFRHVNDNGKDLKLTYASPRFDEALRKLGLGEEKRQEIVEQVMREGTCQHIKELPQGVRDTFVVSADITAEEHVRMQAVLQAFVDNSLSKTVNFHETATEEDVAKAYMLAWELGCKGITVYVTGSREKVVLETQATVEKKEAPVVAAAPAKAEPARTMYHDTKKPRPRALTGKTYNVETPVGKAFITINENGGEHPFEAFINTAKAGSETAAVSEAIGRLISYVLRLSSPISPTERMREIVRQLLGIGGGRSLGFGPNRVRSLPDGIGQVLDMYLREKAGAFPVMEEKNGNGNGGSALAGHKIEEEAENAVAIAPNTMKIGDLCPECGEAAVVNEEGCRKCYACGYSEC
jgi:ribonucleotide reductase alpha subunit